MSENDNKKGMWRTISGRHIFIKYGQTLTEAIKDSGKFREDKKEPTEIEKVLGKEFKGFKGQAAIEKLLSEKQGHINGAFHREDIGDITLIWGDEGSGLQHLINSRQKQGIEDIADFTSNLTDVIENGRVVQINEKGRFEILKDGKMAIIAPQLRDGKITYLFTAYKTRKK